MFFNVPQPGLDFAPQNRQALVVLAIGDKYFDMWSRVARPGWTAYANRHGLDIIAISGRLDSAPRALARSVTWQRCLVLSQPWARRYDRLAVTDADILINPSAPSIFDDMPQDRTKVGAVVLGDQFTDAQIWALLRRRGDRATPHGQARAAYAALQRQFYIDERLGPYDIMISGGVLVLSPTHHVELMERSYAHDGLDLVWEQTIMSDLILRRGLLHRLTPMYNFHLEDHLLIHQPYLATPDWASHPYLPNAGWRTDQPEFQQALITAYADSFFLHFARMSWLFQGLSFA